MADLLSRLRSKSDDATRAAAKHRPVLGRDYYPSHPLDRVPPQRPASDYRDARLPPPIAPPPPKPAEWYQDEPVVHFSGINREPYKYMNGADDWRTVFNEPEIGPDRIPAQRYVLTPKDAVFANYRAATNPENSSTPARLRALIDMIQQSAEAR